jgi:eukaryotic-like serine/threonine-protein kinase
VLEDERGSFTEEIYGRYQLLARLGQGGMAEVFKAKSFGVEGFEKILVIKRILPKLAKNQAFVGMFIHEAKLAVRLSHANIVQVFDLGRVDRGEELPASYYMAMEYVAGLDLATLLRWARKEGKVIPPSMAVYIAAETAKGLDYAHRRRDEAQRPLSIVHRDISPQNILVSWEGEVKVTDFGIAKARDNLDGRPDESSDHLLKGKCSYMSPEQARGQVVDARSDIFSLGVVLYEALAGVNPFSAPTSFETLRRVQAGEFPPIEVLRDELPASLVALVKRALSKSCEERFADAAEMYEELLANLYRSGERFRASDLSEFVTPFRDAPAMDPKENDPELGSIEDGRDRTPVEIPTSISSIRIADEGDSSRSMYSSLAVHRREVTVVVVSVVREGGTVSKEEMQGIREQMIRQGGFVVEEGFEQEITVLFGIVDANGRDAETAVRTSLDMLRKWEGSDLVGSVGVHTGRVLIEAKGQPVCDEMYSTLLRTAQGLSRAIDKRVTVSWAAAKHLQRAFVLEPMPSDRFVLGGSQALLVGEGRTIQQSYGKFVGRREELKLIGKILAQAAKRRLRVLTLVGSEGSGKTRFLHEVDRRLEKGDFHVGFHLVPCTPRGRDHALSGIRSMFQTLCGVRESDSREEILAVEPSLRALGLLDDEVHAVLTLLGVPVEGHEGGGNALRSATTRTMQRLAQDKLQVFAWDNAHCLDAATIDILFAVLDRLGSSRIVVILSGPEGMENPFGDRFQQQTIELKDLQYQEVIRFLASRLAVEDVPMELVSYCTMRAGGHALFLEELLRELLDAGAIETSDGKVLLHRLEDGMSIPRTLRAIISSRIQRLEPEMQAILRSAAIVDEPFELNVIAAVSRMAVDETERYMQTLEQKDWIRLIGAQGYVFVSPIWRDVVADSIPQDARKELYFDVAQVLEKYYESRIDEVADRIADAYMEAGQRERAGAYLIQAAVRWMKLFQYQNAADDIGKAFGLITWGTQSTADLLAWASVLAEAVDCTRVGRDIPELAERLVEEIDSRGTRDERIQIRIVVARALSAISCFDQGIAFLSEIEDVVDFTSVLVQQSIVERARLFARKGDFRSSLEILEPLYSFGLQEELCEKASLLLAQNHAALGNKERALMFLDEATSYGRNTPAAVVEQLKLRGIIYAFARDFQTAAEELNKAVQIARSAGLTYEVAVNLHNFADSLMRCDDYPRAYAALLQSQSVCETCGADRLYSHNEMLLGFLDADKGDPIGEEKLRRCIVYAEDRNYIWDMLDGRFLLGYLLEKQGKFEDALLELNACQELALEVKNTLCFDDCSEAIARCQIGIQTTVTP